jgi:hypothetical protein
MTQTNRPPQNPGRFTVAYEVISLERDRQTHGCGGLRAFALGRTLRGQRRAGHQAGRYRVLAATLAVPSPAAATSGKERRDAKR